MKEPTPRVWPGRGRAAGLVVAWMPVSRRSETLAERLGFEVAVLGRPGFRRPWSAPFAYPILVARTAAAVVARRPRVVVVVVPPILAPLVVLPLASALRAPMAIDIHSGALLERRWRWSIPLLAWLARRAAVSMVTLEDLAVTLRTRGVEPAVVPDPLPAFTASGTAADADAEVVAICGWGDDEPLDHLVEAARGRPWRLVLTGRPRTALDLPPNVSLTGFLDDDAYVERLSRAAALVVLTTRESTLLSGAWEAVALGRPVVLSDTAALRATFGEGPVYVADDAEAIRLGIEQVLADGGAAARTSALRDRFRRENDAALDTVRSRLSDSTPAG